LLRRVQISTSVPYRRTSAVNMQHAATMKDRMTARATPATEETDSIATVSIEHFNGKLID